MEQIEVKNKWWQIEGPDRVGKSTLIKNLKNIIPKEHEVLFTREPGSPHATFCEKIREIIMEEEKGDHDLFLMLADRVYHSQHVVFPALREDKIVISDRGMLSTLIYQRGHPIGTYDIVARCERGLRIKGKVELPNMILLMSDAKTLADRKSESNKFDADYTEDKAQILLTEYNIWADTTQEQELANIYTFHVDDNRDEKELAETVWKFMASTMGINKEKK